MAYPAAFKYTKDHEWIELAGDRGKVGITDYAQQQLGDVVYMDLPDVGERVKAGQSFGTIESVKAVSELYAPVSGEVVEVNTALKDKPEVVNSDPHGKLDDRPQARRSRRNRHAARCRRSTPNWSNDRSNLKSASEVCNHDRCYSIPSRSSPVTSDLTKPKPRQMLKIIGASSLEALMDEAIPASIRLPNRSICRTGSPSISSCGS